MKYSSQQKSISTNGTENYIYNMGLSGPNQNPNTTPVSHQNLRVFGEFHCGPFEYAFARLLYIYIYEYNIGTPNVCCKFSRSQTPFRIDTKGRVLCDKGRRRKYKIYKVHTRNLIGYERLVFDVHARRTAPFGCPTQGAKRRGSRAKNIFVCCCFFILFFWVIEY